MYEIKANWSIDIRRNGYSECHSRSLETSSGSLGSGKEKAGKPILRFPVLPEEKVNGVFWA